MKAARSLLFILFLILPAFPCLASDEPLPPEKGRYTGPCMGEEAFPDAWLDRAHNYITRTLCQPAAWFDGFFGEHRAGEDWPGSLVRWRGGYRIDQAEDHSYRSEIDAGFRLPRMSERFKLTITSKSGDDKGTDQADADPFDPAAPSQDGAAGDRRTTAGLRYSLLEARRVSLSLGGGVKFSDPPDPYVRFRLRVTEPLGEAALVRITPSVIWYRDEGLTRSLRLDVERRLGENILLRGTQSFLRKEQEPGVLWGTSLTLYDRLTPRTSVQLSASAVGTTHPDNRVERYRLATRLRQNVLRRWLFLEIEPELYWPRDEEGRYRRYRAITFLLEMQFYS